MKPFRDLPIQRKLTIVLLIASSATLLLSGTSMVIWEWFNTRIEIVDALTVQARIVSANCSASVAFNDSATANELLGAFKSTPNLVHARILRPDGSVLGAYLADGHPADQPMPAPPGGHAFVGRYLFVAEPVVLDGRTLGRLELEFAFMPTMRAVLTPYLAVSTLVFLANLLLALLLAAQLQRLISVPIRRLSALASRIADHEDYSVRAEPGGRDELGRLTLAFNAMLSRIEAGDTALRTANTGLAAEMAERARLNRELLELSRRAGRAEVATGVLHNVGNVLNSVNVSATLISETVAASELPQLRRVAEFLRPHAGDLAGFFATDPRGALLPRFLDDLATQLAAEHVRLTTELSSLSHNIEHIKQIVAMQQSYASAAAVIEQFDAPEVFAHALDIQRGPLERNHVQVRREIPADLPAIATDRHNLLQILTNFVANAVHALAPNPPDRRELTVRIARHGDDALAFSVRDNGVGIAPEHASHLFTLGFTTRQNGHGFGLHAGALSARALGGRIDFASDGPGAGATFTLVLPLRPPSTTAFRRP